MQNFELFVKSLQSAIVNSTESINKRNESILDEYFYKEASEIILENKEYNKELYTIIQPIRSNNLFIDYVSTENLNVLSDGNLKQNEVNNSQPHISGEDDILANFLFEAYTFNKKNSLQKIANDINNKELINSKLFNKTLIENFNKNKESKEITLDEIKIKKNLSTVLENQLQLLTSKHDELLDKEHAIISDSEELGSQLKNPNLKKTELKKLEDSLTNLNKKIEEISAELASTELEKKEKESNLEDENNSIKELENKLQELIQAVSNNEQSLRLYINKLIQLIEESANVVKLIKTSKVDKSAIIELIKNSKRYIKKNIESLVPKTVRVNYPVTFDFATPDNDKEYKTVSTPVEVPLLTLIPISNYNIEKATFNANFKFNVIDDQVMIDFSKDPIKEGDISNSFGKLEIVLAPQQTPEGLRSLIESYENFLKRQIT